MSGADRVDPVTAEVIRGAVETVAYEMATGGRPGGPNRFTIRAGQPDAERVTHTAAMAPLRAGDAFEWVYGGGGGWGDPFEREPEKVLDDVLDELVSVDGARRDYGVALRGSGDDLDIDWAETERLRKEPSSFPVTRDQPNVVALSELIGSAVCALRETRLVTGIQPLVGDSFQ